MSHIVFVPLSIVSHTRSELNLAWNLLRLHPSLKITWITTSYGLPTLEKELVLRSPHVITLVQDRWNVVELHDSLPRTNASFQDQGVVQAKFKGAFRQIMESDVLPCLVVFDLARPMITSTIKELCLEFRIPRIPAFAMMPTMAFTAFRFIVPEASGGILEKITVNRDNYISHGASQRDASMKAWRHVEGKLLQMPGLPPLYDYEITPQSGARSAPPDCDALHQMYRNSREANGTIWLSSPEIEGPILSELGDLLGGPAIGVGCQLSFDPGLGALGDDSIFRFLEAQKSRHGEGCVLYISFGTLFWPNDRPDIIQIILHTLLELDLPVPFLFATAFGDRIPPELLQRAIESGRGMITPWAPQQQVLEHPAVGLFLCHCGIGAIMESILSLTPFIGLPFGSEQPLNAAYCASQVGQSDADTNTHQLGILLQQFSSDMEGLPLGSGDIVLGTREAMKAEFIGALKRLEADRPLFQANMERMRDTMKQSAEHGESLKAMLGFSQYFPSDTPPLIEG